jgi:hypothetical protein
MTLRPSSSRPSVSWTPTSTAREPARTRATDAGGHGTWRDAGAGGPGRRCAESAGGGVEGRALRRLEQRQKRSAGRAAWARAQGGGGEATATASRETGLCSWAPVGERRDVLRSGRGSGRWRGAQVSAARSREVRRVRVFMHRQRLLLPAALLPRTWRGLLHSLRPSRRGDGGIYLW